MSDDSALQNFMMNTLRGMGTGSSIGSGDGSSGINLPKGLLSGDAPSFEKAQKKNMPFLGVTFSKLCEAFQGQASQLSPQTLGLATYIAPPQTPLGVAKVQGLVNRKGGG
jgi:hypothetical protein